MFIFRPMPRCRPLGKIALLIVLLAQGVLHLQAQSSVVTTENSTGAGSLTEALAAANTWSATNTGSYTISFASNVHTITLPTNGNGQFFVNANVTIDGGGVTLDGNNNDRLFFIAGGTVNLNNLNLINGAANGGYSNRGGGGAGLGGAIFVANGTGITGSNITLATNVTLNGVAFANNKATGGSSGVVSGGNRLAGGGLGGNAGEAGGGGVGNEAEGGLAGAGTGNPGIFIGAQRGGPGYQGAGGINGGGGGGSDQLLGGGGGGGVAGGFGVGPDGGYYAGNGGWGGGGGAASQSIGGSGGFGGGGGFGTYTGGQGGFGGGGGGAANGDGGLGAGAGGFGGGHGIIVSSTVTNGGGGLGAGGAVFVMNGANLVVINSSYTGDAVAGGHALDSGQAYGNGYFLLNSLTLSATPGTPHEVSEAIYANDTNPADLGTTILPGLTIGDAAHPGGTVHLTGANLYYGDTTLTNSAALEAQPGMGLPTASKVVLAGGVYQFVNTSTATITLGYGTGSNVFNWLSGGFSSRGSDLTLTVNTGDPLVWGSTANFVENGQPLIFGSDTSNGAITVTNKLDLGSTDTQRTILVANSNTAVFSDLVSGGNGLILNDATHAGTLVLPASLYSGDTTIYAGSLVFYGGSLLRGSLNLAGAGATWDTQFTSLITNQTIQDLSGVSGTMITLGTKSLTFGTANSTTFAGVIQGSGSVHKMGSGTVTFSGNNTYTGGTFVDGGTLVVSTNANLGDSLGGVSIGNGTLKNTTDIITSRNVALIGDGATIETSGYLTINGKVSGSGGLTKTGSNILTFNGDVTYAGATTISDGLFKVTGSKFLSSGVYIANGATLTFENSQTYAGGITGDGKLYHSFSGTTILTGDVAPGGGTYIEGGTIQIGDGGTTGTLSGPAQVQDGTLAFNRRDDSTYLSSIDGNGAVTKAGAGTLTFSGTSSYSGGTTINGGVLAVTNDAALGTGNVTVAAGRLQIGLGHSIANTITLAGGDLAQEIGSHTQLSTLRSYHGLLVPGIPVEASFLDGQASAAATITGGFSQTSLALNDYVRLSDVFHLSGVSVVNELTGETDIFDLQLKLDHISLGDYLGWLNPETNVWMNAVDGNFGGTTNFILGAYNAADDFHLGTYGVDMVNGTVWAVLNHNSDFAVVVPEPSTWLLLGLGLTVMAWYPRRRT